MNGFEQRLKTAKLAEPSAEQDRRMEQLFAAPPQPRAFWLCRPIPLWACCAAAVMCGLLGYVLGPSLAPQPVERSQTIVYMVPEEVFMSRDASASATGPLPFGVPFSELEWRVDGHEVPSANEDSTI